MNAWDAIAIIAALAVFTTWLAWLGRTPCPHADVVRLDDRDSVCLDCDELLRTEDVQR